MANKHESRKPKCNCDNPEPKKVGGDLDVAFEMCEKCKGVIE